MKRKTFLKPTHKLNSNYLARQLPFPNNEIQCCQQQANTMAPIAKHYSKKERECDDCIHTGICFLVLGNPGTGNLLVNISKNDFSN